MNVLAGTRYRVFGSATFRGNPVTLFAVDALDDGASLQRTAQASSSEDNVFYVTTDDGPVLARFYSSTAELWLCGHGLLALSHHLHASGVEGPREVQSTFGTWRIHADAQGPGVLLPAQHASAVADSTHWMKQALHGIGIEHEGLHRCPNKVWIAILRDMPELLAIDATAVATLSCRNAKPGALIAAVRMQDGAYGFRYFAPWHGKPEDSGTGSAHCYLAPLLARAHVPLTALQFSPEGVAEMGVCLRGDGVALAGKVELYP